MTNFWRGARISPHSPFSAAVFYHPFIVLHVNTFFVTLFLVQPDLLRRPLFVLLCGSFKEFKQHWMKYHATRARMSATVDADSVDNAWPSPPLVNAASGVHRATAHSEWVNEADDL